jgi:hypothetical protein
MRAAPEAGMGSLLIVRSDSNEPEHMRYWHTDTQARILAFRQNAKNIIEGSGELVSLEAFRPLDEGEIDFTSRGGANFFMGNRPHIDMRAGIVSLKMDQDEAEFGTKSPLHIRRGYQNRENSIIDEERFGVVRRQVAGSYVDKFFPDSDGKQGQDASGFAKEHLIRMSNAQGTAPAVLFDTRIGNSMDDDGIPYTLDDTGLNLRARVEYFTPTETSVLAQLDENGNFKIEHPIDANIGGSFSLPAGTLKAQIGLNFERTVGRNEDVSIGVDRIQSIGNDDIKEVGNIRRITVIGDEIRLLQANSMETVEGNKTIAVKGSLAVSTGLDTSKMNFTNTSGSFECDVFTVLAKSIVLEAPLVTISGNLDVTGTIKAGGVLSNSGIVAPNLQRKDFSGTKGTAGSLSSAKAIRS